MAPKNSFSLSMFIKETMLLFYRDHKVEDLHFGVQSTHFCWYTDVELPTSDFALSLRVLSRRGHGDKGCCLEAG